MLTVLSAVAALVMATVLLWAGLEKVRSLRSTASTLRSLGVSEFYAPSAAALLALTEVGIALGLIFRPGATWVRAGVLALALAFASAGLLALVRGGSIRCNCFGPGVGDLGVGQIWALVPWLAGASLLAWAAPEIPLGTGAGLLATVAGIMVLARATPISRAWAEARADRRSAEEMYTWLPR